MLLGTTTTTSGVDFSGVTLPFTTSDLLSSVTGLLGILGPFVLLGIAILFTPKLINLIKGAAATKGK